MVFAVGVAEEEQQCTAALGDADEEQQCTAALGDADEACSCRQLPSLKGDAVQYWCRNWHYISALFGVVHAVSCLIMAYSTAILSGDLGSYGSAAFYAWWFISSICLGNQVTCRLGSKRAMIFGAFLYDIQYLTFVVCSALGTQHPLVSALAIGSYVLGGLGAGILWTAEGVYFTRSCELLASASGGRMGAWTSTLAVVFAIWNLGVEVAMKLVTAELQRTSLPLWIPPALASALALIATLLMSVCCVDLPNESPKRSATRFSGIRSTWTLCTHLNLWLLAATNLTFGFAAAFVNGVVNGRYTKHELGLSAVGLLMALTSSTAALSQVPYRIVAHRCGKGAVLAFGALCFACIPLVVLVLPMGTAGWWLTIVYLCQGFGRGAYESINRAVFADFYAGSLSEGAFANVAMQQALAFSGAFALSPHLSDRGMTSILLVLASLIVPGYAIARCRQRRSIVKAAADGAECAAPTLVELATRPAAAVSEAEALSPSIR